MSGSDMRERAARSPETAGQVFDLLTPKLRRPVVRPGTVPRLALTERLARGDPRPIVSVVASPGYGKTTLLSQVCRSGWSRSAAGSARAEDVVGEHGDGTVDEAYVPVAAGVVGELLAG
jgi:hypothetical protein